MKIRIPDSQHPGKTKRIRITFKTMCIISIIIALIVVAFGLPAIAEFPIALIAITVYAIWAYYETRRAAQEKQEEQRKQQDRKKEEK